MKILGNPQLTIPFSGKIRKITAVRKSSCSKPIFYFNFFERAQGPHKTNPGAICGPWDAGWGPLSKMIQGNTG